MKIYIAGPMTGLPEHNFPAFEKAADHLRNTGNWDEVVSPREHANLNKNWQDSMRVALGLLIQCDAIYLLNGWGVSRGAVIERNVAEALGMIVLKQP